MSFETTIASRNSDTFFSEFTFSSGKFRSQTGQELELCDGAVWLDELLILFQLKERSAEHDSKTADAEAKWFDKKVSKLAVNQIADTVKYLETEKTLPLANLRAQTIDLRQSQVPNPFKVALHLPSEHLPDNKLYWKGRTSQRVGFVHFIHAHDYINVCDTLCTPYEVSDYLRFREQMVLTVPAANTVSEKALFGNYLSDTDPNALCDMDELMVDAFVDDRADFSISQMLSTFFETIVSGNDGTMYHAILAELAKLRRNMMKLLRVRLRWAMDKCNEKTQEKPSRFYSPESESKCSFIVIPLPLRLADEWEREIKIYTHLCKYDFRSQKCVGITVASNPDSPDTFRMNWLYLDYDWQQNDEFDSLLKEHPMFRKTRGELIGKYKFKFGN